LRKHEQELGDLFPDPRDLGAGADNIAFEVDGECVPDYAREQLFKD
jgi:hypothetical protein